VVPYYQYTAWCPITSTPRGVLCTVLHHVVFSVLYCTTWYSVYCTPRGIPCTVHHVVYPCTVLTWCIPVLSSRGVPYCASRRGVPYCASRRGVPFGLTRGV